MKLTKDQIEFINGNDYVVFTTSWKDTPRSALVVPSKVYENKIIISDVLMKTSNENVKKNPNVFIASYDKDASKGIKIVGRAEYYASGDLFEEIKAFEISRGFEPKGIIVVEFDDVRNCTSDE